MGLSTIIRYPAWIKAGLPSSSGHSTIALHSPLASAVGQKPRAPANQSPSAAPPRCKLEAIADCRNFPRQHGLEFAPCLTGKTFTNPREAELAVVVTLHDAYCASRATAKENLCPTDFPMRPYVELNDTQERANLLSIPHHLSEKKSALAKRFHENEVGFTDTSGKIIALANNKEGTQPDFPNDGQQNICISFNAPGPNFPEIIGDSGYTANVQNIREQSPYHAPTAIRLGSSLNGAANEMINVHESIHRGVFTPTIGFAFPNIGSTHKQMIVNDRKDSSIVSDFVSKSSEGYAKLAQKLYIGIRYLGKKMTDRMPADLHSIGGKEAYPDFAKPHAVGIIMRKPGENSADLMDIMGPEVTQNNPPAGIKFDRAGKMVNRVIGDAYEGIGIIEVVLQDEHCRVEGQSEPLPLQSDQEKQEAGTATRSSNFGVHDLRKDKRYAQAALFRSMLEDYRPLCEKRANNEPVSVADLPSHNANTGDRNTSLQICPEALFIPSKMAPASS